MVIIGDQKRPLLVASECQLQTVDGDYFYNLSCLLVVNKYLQVLIINSSLQQLIAVIVVLYCRDCCSICRCFFVWKGSGFSKGCPGDDGSWSAAWTSHRDQPDSGELLLFNRCRGNWQTHNLAQTHTHSRQRRTPRERDKHRNRGKERKTLRGAARRQIDVEMWIWCLMRRKSMFNWFSCWLCSNIN